MDFLLILIRQFLKRNSKTKIILMSATMDSEHFARYFQSVINNKVPILSMKIAGPYTITTHFLDDFVHNNKRMVDFDRPGISDQLMKRAADIIFDHVKEDKKSSILVFLPGYYEIESFERVLNDKFDVNHCHEIIILHSAITTEEQKMAFTNDLKPKIILSTNIAENSVTIPTVNVVIDFCLTKYLVASPESNMASLKINWTSKTSCLQRAGRTGRVCDGDVYHMVPKRFYDMEMPMFTVPEMKRIPLERVILKTKMIESNSSQSPLDFLRMALDPPGIENVRTSILILKELGALKRYNDNGEIDPDDGELTFCGRIMATLPCDVYIGKFIMLGYTFSVLKEAVIIAAALAINGSIFKFDHKDRVGSYSTRISWSDGSGSDLIAMLNAYQLWRQTIADGQLHCRENEKFWFERLKLDPQNIYEMKALIKEFRYRLEENRIHVLEDQVDNGISKPLLIKLCIAGAFLPYYYTLQSRQSDFIELEVYKEVEGADVYRSIMFRDADKKYVPLYNDILKKTLVDRRICSSVDEIDIIHNPATSKIIVTFKRHENLQNMRDLRGISLVDGNIVPEVYMAIKEREISHGNFKLHVMSHHTIRNYADNVGFEHEMNNTTLNQSLTSSFHLDAGKIRGIITHVEDCGKFFFQPVGTRYHLDKLNMDSKISDAPLTPIEDELQLSHNDPVIVRYKGNLQRGIVSKISNEPVKYRLIDLGVFTSNIPLHHVHQCPKSLIDIFDFPEKCFQCRLARLAPSHIKCPQGVWTDDANNYFRKLVGERQVKIEIFSVVGDVVAVELFANDGVAEEPISVNAKMNSEQYAVYATEDYLSRLDNDGRNSSILSFEKTTSLSSKISTKPLIPPRGMLNMCLALSGPSSPLESSLQGVLGLEKSMIKVDPQSVNSVVLNGDIKECSSRLFVAANVTRNRLDGITLRDMTMMPQIPGIAELLAILFCPKMVLRCDEKMTRYKSLQVGLGCDPKTNHALFPMHDAIFPVNVKITDQDFANINEVRSSISKLLSTAPAQLYPDLTDGVKVELQKKILSLSIE